LQVPPGGTPQRSGFLCPETCPPWGGLVAFFIASARAINLDILNPLRFLSQALILPNTSWNFLFFEISSDCVCQSPLSQDAAHRSSLGWLVPPSVPPSFRAPIASDSFNFGEYVDLLFFPSDLLSPPPWPLPCYDLFLTLFVLRDRRRVDLAPFSPLLLQVESNRSRFFLSDADAGCRREAILLYAFPPFSSSTSARLLSGSRAPS